MVAQRHSNMTKLLISQCGCIVCGCGLNIMSVMCLHVYLLLLSDNEYHFHPLYVILWWALM